MKKLVSVLVIIAIFTIQCNGFAGRRRRQADEPQDTGVVALVETGLNMAKGLPIIGDIVSFATNWVQNMWNAMQDLTNGMFARVLGGALPCTMSFEAGFVCTGITDDNNVATLIIQVLDHTPLPNFLKSIIEVLLNSTFNPITNIIFGGVDKYQ